MKRYISGDPLGRTVGLGPNCSTATIVGVVANSTGRPRIAPRPFVYRPYAYQPTQLTFTVRAVNPVALIPPLRCIVAGLDTRIFDPVTTGIDYRARTMSQERLFTILLSVFGALALFIACIGIYGTTIYMVRRRTAEIGIRMSLGARQLDVIRLVTRETLAPVAIGIAAGIAAAVELANLAVGILFGVSHEDPWAIAAAASLLLFTSACAAAVPARIASKIEPLSALRYD